MSEEQAQYDKQEWLTTNQAADMYGVSKNSVYKWCTERKVITNTFDGTRYISKSSIDAHLERQKEERKQRDIAFGIRSRKQPADEISVSNQDEVSWLKQQVQELTFENGRLTGEVGVYQKELGRLHTLIKELVVPAR